MAEDEDAIAEAEAVMGCFQDGFEDGWNCRRKNMNSYDQKAYERGYQEGATAARGTFYGRN